MELLKEFLERLSLITFIYLSILGISLLTTSYLWLTINLLATLFYLIACRLLWQGFSNKYKKELKQLDHLVRYNKIDKEV